ncbi:hypothetical protein [Caudoviricetes sp.]|nr:hypothetical protein [Caudoviricetes sp.]
MSTFTNFRDNHWLGKSLWWTFTMIDRCINQLWNGDFSHTLSAYLGKYDRSCRLCRWLDHIEQDHCIKAAKREGLLK